MPPLNRFPATLACGSEASKWVGDPDYASPQALSDWSLRRTDPILSLHLSSHLQPHPCSPLPSTPNPLLLLNHAPPSHCTHSSHRYSESKDNKLIDSLKLTGSLIYTLVCPKYFYNWVNWVYKHNQFQPRCHHAAHAYTGVPCSKHKRRRSRRDARDPRDGVLPRLPGGAGNTAKSGRMRSFNPKVVLKHAYVKNWEFLVLLHLIGCKT